MKKQKTKRKPKAGEETLVEGRCHYMLENGKICGRKTESYKYICDLHAEEVEAIPYGRFCEFCGMDTFNEKYHRKGCPERG